MACHGIGRRAHRVGERLHLTGFQEERQSPSSHGETIRDARAADASMGPQPAPGIGPP